VVESGVKKPENSVEHRWVKLPLGENKIPSTSLRHLVSKMKMYADLTRKRSVRCDGKKLHDNSCYFLGSPKALGVVMERKPLTVENTMGAIVGQSWRGWYMEQIESQVVVNARSVVRGQRV